MDEPSNSFSSPSTFDILSSNQTFIRSFQINSNLKYSNLGSDSLFTPGLFDWLPSAVRPKMCETVGQYPNFNSSMSSVKYAQWLSMDRTQNLHKPNYEKFIKHHHKIRLFQSNTIPINVNFSSVFFGFGILGWQNLKYFKRHGLPPVSRLENVKAYYYNEKRLFSPIIKVQLSRSIKSFKIMTTMNKSKSKYFLFRSSHFKINFISVCKDKLKPTQPWIIASFNQQQFPCRSSFLKLTKIKDFITYHQNLKGIKKNKMNLTFPWLGEHVLKNHEFSSFFKFSIPQLVASFKHKKLKNLLGLSSKPKSQNIITIPEKIMPTPSVKPRLSFYSRSLLEQKSLFQNRQTLNSVWLRDVLKNRLQLKNNTPNFFLRQWPIRYGLPHLCSFPVGRPIRHDYSFLFKPNHPRHRLPTVGRLEEDEWPTLQATALKKINISNTNLTKTSHLTYSSEFYIPVQIIDQISKKMYLRWLLLADLPIQTKRGHFIINGYPKTVIHQIVRSPGIRFKNEDNQILADIISMRGAWMGIQIVYEKNVKAANVGLKNQASRVVSLQTKRESGTQNKIINKSMFQGNPENIHNSLGSTPSFSPFGLFWNKRVCSKRDLESNDKRNLININQNKRTTNSINQNIRLGSDFPSIGNKQARKYPYLVGSLYKNFQPSRYPYQTNFLQNAIMKSEKIDHLPTPTLNLLKAKHENKAIQKFKHWPGAFFYSKPIYSIQAPTPLPLETNGRESTYTSLGANEKKFRLDKSKKLLVQEISPGPLKQQNKYELPSINHHFGHCVFWTSTHYKNKLISLLMMKSGLNDKLIKILTPKLLSFPLNAIKESEKIHEALSINFFISSSRTDKTDKKRIQLSGFAFLDYLFDHPYFVYNNYVPSWQKSSFFPTSVLMKNTIDTSYQKNLRFSPTSFYSRSITAGGKPGVEVESKPRLYRVNQPKRAMKKDLVWPEKSLDTNAYTEPFSSFKISLNYGLISEKIWPFFKNQTHSHDLIKRVDIYNFYRNKNTESYPGLYDKPRWTSLWSESKQIWSKESYPSYFTTRDTFLKNLTWRFLKKIKHTRFSKRWPCLMQESSFKIYPLLNDLNESIFLSLLGKGIDNSFLVRNINAKSDLEDFRIQAPTRLPLQISSVSKDPKSAKRYASTKNKNPSLWVTTPTINNSAQNIRWASYHNTDKKYLNAMKNHTLMIPSNEILREKFIHGFSYLPYSNQEDNLLVLQKNHNGFLHNKLNQENQESHAYLDTPSQQAWTNEFTNKGIESERILSSNQLLASLVSMCGLNLKDDIILSI